MQKIAREFKVIQINIPAAGSLSAATDLAGDGQGSLPIMAIIMPNTWTAAVLSFQGARSLDGTFRDIYDSNGNEFTIQASANRCITYIPELAPFRFLKIRSGTSSSPVPQNGERPLQILVTG